MKEAEVKRAFFECSKLLSFGLRILFTVLILRKVYMETGAWTCLFAALCSVALEVVIFIQHVERKLAKERWRVLCGVVDLMKPKITLAVEADFKGTGHHERG